MDKKDSQSSLADRALREAREALDVVRSGQASVATEVRYEGARAYVVTKQETRKQTPAPFKRLAG